MNATTTTTTAAAHLAAGTYTWQRPGVLLAATVAAGTVTAELYTRALGTQPVPADLAAPALLEALAELPVQYQPAPAPVYLTRQRARAMHKELGRLGLPADARYALAAELLGRPVESLTALTEQEARTVWLAACNQAQAAAEQATVPGPDASREEVAAYGAALLR